MVAPLVSFPAFAFPALPAFPSISPSLSHYLTLKFSDYFLRDHCEISTMEFNTNRIHEHGYGIEGGFGWNYKNTFRFEATVGYKPGTWVVRKNPVKGGMVTNTLKTGYFFLVGNAYYNFKTSTNFSPFIGGGFGYTRMDAGFDGEKITEEEFVRAYGRKSHWIPMFDVTAGFDYKINEKWNLNVAYRYIDSGHTSFDVGYTSATPHPSERVRMATRAHEILFGIRYTL